MSNNLTKNGHEKFPFHIDLTNKTRYNILTYKY